MSILSPLPSKPIRPFFPPLHSKPPNSLKSFKKLLNLKNTNPNKTNSSHQSNISPQTQPILLDDWPHLLQISIESRDFQLGTAIHGFLVKSASQNDPFQGNNLINMYAKFERLNDAQKVLNEMPIRNTITWTSLINGYSRIGDFESVFQIAREMHQCGEQFSEHTCTAVLQACGSPQDHFQGEQIHGLIVKRGFETNTFVGTSLVSMYSRNGFLNEAEMVFEALVDIDVRCLNSIILGYGKMGDVEKSIRVFRKFQDSSFEPNDYTFTNVISACNGGLRVEEGRQLHGLAIKFGFVAASSVGNTIITMYGEHGLVEEAEKMFLLMGGRNLVSWTAILSGYVKNGHWEKAFDGFVKMLDLGLSFDSCCLATVIDGCSECTNLEWGVQIHGFVIKLGYRSDVLVGTALIDTYAKCRDLKSAMVVLNGLSDQNTASLNAILAGYTSRDGDDEEDFMGLFNRLRLMGMDPDFITFSRLLSLSADQASLVIGKALHSYTIKAGFEIYIPVGNAIITMYAKCGSIEDSRRMFSSLPSHDSVSWKALVSGYAIHGQGNEALLLFEQMEREGFEPDEITLLSVLQACCYSGLYEDGFHVFNSMERRYGIKPIIEHHVCMVDLLGRAGHISEAMEFIKQSSFASSIMLWRTLVSVCKFCGDLNFGRLASKSLLDLKPDDAASYILVSNMYAKGGMLEESAKVRVMMKDREIKKEAGCSSIAIENKVHRFIAGGKEHMQSREIYAKLDELSDVMKKKGYVPEIDLLLQDV